MAAASFGQQITVTGHIVEKNPLYPHAASTLPPSSLCADCKVGAPVTLILSGVDRNENEEKEDSYLLYAAAGNSLTVQIGSTKVSTDYGRIPNPGSLLIAFENNYGIGSLWFQKGDLTSATAVTYVFMPDGAQFGRLLLQGIPDPDGRKKNVYPPHFSIGRSHSEPDSFGFFVSFAQ